LDEGNAASLNFTFEQGGDDALRPHRTIDVEFDSTGQLRSITINAGRIDDQGRATIDAHVLSFHPSGNFVSAMTFATASESKDAAALSRPATREELEQVRNLAAWLWEHRCNPASRPSRQGRQRIKP
jgi:hypothetical protein